MTKLTTVQIVLTNSYENSVILWNTTTSNGISLETDETRTSLTTNEDDVNKLNNWWAMLATILVLGTAAGNILVCLAISLERRLQNVTNYFLMSLAITDLMVAILVMPLGILTLVRGKFTRI